MEATAEIPQLEKTVGADGKARKQTARKTKADTQSADDMPTAEEANESYQQTPRNLTASKRGACPTWTRRRFL
jgi:hypothetical protein